MPTLAEDIKQAREFQKMLNKALAAFIHQTSIESTESVIQYRYTTAVGFLTILLSDTTNMIKCWESLDAP